MIDSHCHLEMVQEKIPLDQIIENFRQEGGKALLTISTDPGSLIFLRQDFSNYHLPIFISSGWHPHEAKTYSKEVETQLESLATHSNCIAIGEIGLDYYYDHSPKPVQHQCFISQLELAKKLNLPVIIHTRDAEEDTLKILDDFGYPHVLIHCFTGTYDFAKNCWDRGYLTSFSGIITFKSALELQKVVKDCPRNLYLIETDAPFLAPIPHRGKTNQPALVKYVAQACSLLKGLSLDEVLKDTNDNFTKFFFTNFQKNSKL